MTEKFFWSSLQGLILPQTENKRLQSVETTIGAAPGWARVVTQRHLLGELQGKRPCFPCRANTTFCSLQTLVLLVAQRDEVFKAPFCCHWGGCVWQGPPLHRATTTSSHLSTALLCLAELLSRLLIGRILWSCSSVEALGGSYSSATQI